MINETNYDGEKKKRFKDFQKRTRLLLVSFTSTNDLRFEATPIYRSSVDNDAIHTAVSGSVRMESYVVRPE